MLPAGQKAKRMRMIPVSVLAIAIVIATQVPESTSQTGQAQTDAAPTIRSVALGRGLQPNTELMVILQQNVLGLIEHHVVEFDSNTLVRTGHTLSETMYGFNDETLTTQPFAGTSRIATSAFTVDEYQIRRDSAGALQLTDPITTGPFGDPRTDGRPTAFAVLPQPRDPTGPWIVIGTDIASVILAKSGIIPCTIPVGGPVVDLAVVPQVGYFAIVALVNRRDRQHLVGIRAPEPGAGCSAQIAFDLFADGLSESDWKMFTAEPLLDDPLSQPTAVHIIAANASHFLHRLTIPSNPTVGGTFEVHQLKPADSPISRVAITSNALAMLPVDVAGVLYDPAFNPEGSGVSKRLFTIFGSSLEVRPRILSLNGSRSVVSAFIEVADGKASQINAASIGIVFGGTMLANTAINAQLEPDDADNDGNLDLEVKIDRASLQRLVPPGSAAVLITAHWRFTDGSTGFASTEIRIKPDGEDDDDS